jgi:hypothetical protein
MFLKAIVKIGGKLGVMVGVADKARIVLLENWAFIESNFFVA